MVFSPLGVSHRGYGPAAGHRVLRTLAGRRPHPLARRWTMGTPTPRVRTVPAEAQSVTTPSEMLRNTAPVVGARRFAGYVAIVVGLATVLLIVQTSAPAGTPASLGPEIWLMAA